jgi:hypothetical protein
MADDFLKDRTFQLYYFDPKPFPDFAAQEKCGANHHRQEKVAYDFRALQLHEDALRPTILKFKDQNFQAVATEWELKHSVILNADGVTPIVDDEGVVVAHLGDRDPVATYMRPIVDVDGHLVMEFWDETPLAPSVPFEVGTAVAGGFGARAGAKAAVRKAMSAAPVLIRLRGALRGALLKTFLRKRIVPKQLPDVQRSFDYGLFDSNVPSFHAHVTTHQNDVLFEISHQVTKFGTEAQRLTAAQLRKQALQYAAEQAKLRGQQTFKMRVKYASPGSREAADKLVRKAGKPQMTKASYTPGATNPNMEYVLETEKVLATVIE